MVFSYGVYTSCIIAITTYFEQFVNAPLKFLILAASAGQTRFPCLTGIQRQSQGR